MFLSVSVILKKFTQEECTAYSQLSAFANNSEHGPPLSFKTLILGCLNEFIADVLTDIALDHKIHIYDSRHEVCSDLVGNPEDRFAHDAAHIKQHFFYDLRHVSLHWQRLYNKYHTCRDIVSFSKT